MVNLSSERIFNPMRYAGVKVLFGDYLGDEWLIGKGFRQFGVLSLLLFSLYINDVNENIRTIGFGFQLEFYRVNIVAYADGILLLSSSTKSLQIMIDKVTFLLQKLS